jgi:hypothetical protein
MLEDCWKCTAEREESSLETESEFRFQNQNPWWWWHSNCYVFLFNKVNPKLPTVNLTYNNPPISLYLTRVALASKYVFCLGGSEVMDDCSIISCCNGIVSKKQQQRTQVKSGFCF